MNHIFEIWDTGNDVVQRVATLKPGEREKIEAAGFRIVKRELSAKVWDWVLGDA